MIVYRDERPPRSPGAASVNGERSGGNFLGLYFTDLGCFQDDGRIVAMVIFCIGVFPPTVDAASFGRSGGKGDEGGRSYDKSTQEITQSKSSREKISRKDCAIDMASWQLWIVNDDMPPLLRRVAAS